MRAVDVGAERREFIVEGVTDETLGCQMVALVGSHLAHNAENAGETIQRARVQVQAVDERGDAAQAPRRVFQSHAAHNAVNFVTLLEQEFRQVGAVLSSNSGDECGWHGGRGLGFNVFRELRCKSVRPNHKFCSL